MFLLKYLKIVLVKRYPVISLFDARLQVNFGFNGDSRESIARNYVSRIPYSDQENLHVVGGENPDGRCALRIMSGSVGQTRRFQSSVYPIPAKARLPARSRTPWDNRLHPRKDKNFDFAAVSRGWACEFVNVAPENPRRRCSSKTSTKMRERERERRRRRRGCSAVGHEFEEWQGM